MYEYAFEMLMDFVDKFPKCTEGPGHIIFDDQNASNDDILWVIGLIDHLVAGSNDQMNPEYALEIASNDGYPNNNQEELKATKNFLLKYIEVPEFHRIGFEDGDM
ncbi:MAG: hypothetical protein AAGD96_06570 [Chloroflexota bacterium]